MKRIPELDALRGLAAVAIVVYHLWFPKQGFMGTAVDLFFVMSGYLITTIIIKQREQPGFLVTFYARRSLRIWPIYYLSLLAFLIFNPALPRPAPTQALPYFLTYAQNLPLYWGENNPPFAHGFYHTWSLAVEEQYYLIWPLLLVLLGRRSVVPLALGLIALAIGARMAGYPTWILLTKCDGLALGGILAVVMGLRESARLKTTNLPGWLVAIGVGSVGFLAVGNRAFEGLGLDPSVALSLRLFVINLLYFSLIGLIILASGHRWLAWLRDVRLVELGQMSYGIYLYHYILFDVVQDYADAFGVSSRFVIDPVKLGLSFAIAWASWRLVERPLLSLKDRFGYKPGAISAPKGRPELAGLESLPSGAR